MRLPKLRIVAPFCISLLLAARSLPAQHQGMEMDSARAAGAANLPLRIMANGKKTALTAAELKALPHQTVTAHNGHSNTDESYSGVPLIELLVKAGVPNGEKLHGKALSDYVVATGADGYKAVLALAETDPSFHPGEVIVADALDGKPLDAKTGPFKLVVTEDKRPARSVHSLVSIEVRTAE